MVDTQVALEGLKGWAKLDKQTQRKASDAAVAVDLALKNEAESHAEAGRRLLELREILPKGMFLAAVRETFHMSRATAYRYMGEAKKLPKPVMEVVMRRAYRPAQIKRIEDNPPPAKIAKNPIQLGRYFDKLERTPVEEKPPTTFSRDSFQREVTNFFRNRFERLPRDTKRDVNANIEAGKEAIGMMLKVMGLASAQTIEPRAIPDKFRVVRGRPRFNRAA